MSRPRRQFTLIELLVVIAIIAVLASMLLPALASARSTAVRTKCLNRTKQMNLGIQFYRDDHDSWYPVDDIWTTGTIWGDPSPVRYRFITMVAPYVQAPGTIGVHTSVAENLFWCAASGFTKGTTNWNTIRDNYGYYISTDIVGNFNMQANFGFSLTTGGPYNPKKEVTGDASSLIMMGSTMSGTYNRFGYVTGGTAAVTFFHDGRTNLLFADGHAASYQQTGTGSGKIHLQSNGIRFK